MAKITLKEIAEKANVSIGTVDRVLHNRGGANEETANRIRRICEEYGYEGNIVGKAMALQRKESRIAVVINSQKRSAFSKVTHDAINEFAKEVADYNVKYEFYDLMENSVSEICKILDNLYQEDIDGLIIKPIDSTIVKYKLQKLHKDKNIPIVNCASTIEGVDSICYVGQDHHKLGRMMASTLYRIKKDDLKIIAAVGPLSNPSRRQKLEGFIEYLQDKKSNFDILNICEIPFDEVEARTIFKDLIPRYPEANVLYLNSPEISVPIDVLEKDIKFEGIKCVFAHKDYVSEKLRNGSLDFAVYENPFDQGYMAAKVVFNYLLNGDIPKDRKIILEGQIVFDENC